MCEGCLVSLKMRPSRSSLLAILVVIGLVAGVTSAPRTDVAASSATAFAGPAYPSERCTPEVEVALDTWLRIGLAPQQWNAVAGMPTNVSSAAAPQRIVIGQFGQVPNMIAVNALMRQCGLPEVDISSVQWPPEGWSTDWKVAPEIIGAEPTLDFSVVASALPPNAEIRLANIDPSNGAYGLLLNAALNCGLEVDGTPALAGPVARLSKGGTFPTGGCIITISYGEAEANEIASGQLTTDARLAGELLDQLSALNVVTFVSTGDEGSGGCIIGGTSKELVNAPVSWAASPPTVPTLSSIWSGTATVTLAGHGFSAGQPVLLAGATAPLDDEIYRNTLNGAYFIRAADANTFTVQVPLTSENNPTLPQISGIIYAVAGDFGVDFDSKFAAAGFLVQDGELMPQFLSTNPNVVAVGGTQWIPQADSLRDPLLPYIPEAQYGQFVWKDSSGNNNCANAPSPTTTGQQGGTGGQSLIFSMPQYQRTQARATYPEAPLRRMVPDVSGLAGWPEYALGAPSLVVDNFCRGETTRPPCASNRDFPWQPVVGTSAATPLTAVGIANVNAMLTARGFAPIDKAGGAMDVHNIIYNPAFAAAIVDVPASQTIPGSGTFPSGDNDIFGFGCCTAADGYDMATGMGVANFTRLANLLIARNAPAPAPPAPAPPAPAPAPTAPAQPEPVAPAPAPNPVDQVIANPTLVTAPVLSALTPAQVAQIPPQTFGQLPAPAFRGLTTQQARSLTSAQVAAIRPARARAIRPAVLRALTPAQMRVMRPASVRSLRPSQVRLLRPVQFAGLSNKQVRAMRPVQVKELNRAQIRALTARQRVVNNKR